jgi:hypothetical protein
MEIQGTEDRIAAIDAEIVEIDTELARVQEQKLQSQERLTALSSVYYELRLERGKALAAEEDASAITKKLRKIAEEVEELRDAVAALTPPPAKLAEKKKALVAERRLALLDFNRAAYRVVARRYNDKAAELAPILQELWDARATANEGGTGRVVKSPAGWIDGLTSLPRLFIDEDGPLPAMKRDHFFCDEKTWVADTARRRFAEIEARRSAAGETVDAR